MISKVVGFHVNLVVRHRELLRPAGPVILGEMETKLLLKLNMLEAFNFFSKLMVYAGQTDCIFSTLNIFVFL